MKKSTPKSTPVSTTNKFNTNALLEAFDSEWTMAKKTSKKDVDFEGVFEGAVKKTKSKPGVSSVALVELAGNHPDPKVRDGALEMMASSFKGRPYDNDMATIAVSGSRLFIATLASHFAQAPISLKKIVNSDHWMMMDEYLEDDCLNEFKDFQSYSRGHALWSNLAIPSISHLPSCQKINWVYLGLGMCHCIGQGVDDQKTCEAMDYLQKSLEKSIASSPSGEVKMSTLVYAHQLVLTNSLLSSSDVSSRVIELENILLDHVKSNPKNKHLNLWDSNFSLLNDCLQDVLYKAEEKNEQFSSFKERSVIDFLKLSIHGAQIQKEDEDRQLKKRRSSAKPKNEFANDFFYAAVGMIMDYYDDSLANQSPICTAELIKQAAKLWLDLKPTKKDAVDACADAPDFFKALVQNYLSGEDLSVEFKQALRKSQKEAVEDLAMIMPPEQVSQCIDDFFKETLLKKFPNASKIYSTQKSKQEINLVLGGLDQNQPRTDPSPNRQRGKKM